MPFGSQFDVAVHSSAGTPSPLRHENQDNYLLIDAEGQARFLHEQQPRTRTVPGWPSGHVRLAVLDGMGGHGRGREAAEAVVAGLLAMPACARAADLSQRLDALHNALQHHFGAERDLQRPGTTLTLLECQPGHPALLYHVGDSRLYEIAGARITPMTIDHVPATACALGGLMDEQEWRQQVHGEHRSQISQAFILGNAFANPAALADPLFELSPLNLPGFLTHLSDRRAVTLREGACYVLATDGFWACERPDQWVARWPALLGQHCTAAGKLQALFDAAASAEPGRFHPDNLTALVLRVRGHGADETAAPANEISQQ